MTLKGQTILITGASRGIGKAIALRAAADGARVADGIAVNALWPRTAIDTAAIGFIMDDDARRRSRLPAIMADAAHLVFSQPARVMTGRFLIDEDVLRKSGVTDFAKYRHPGVREDELIPDFFV